MKQQIIQRFGFCDNWLEKYIDIVLQPDATVGENHHIFPKSLFGENDVIVKLSLVDHMIAHWYLYKAYTDNRHMIENKDFVSICFALSSFNQINDERRRKLSLLTEDEMVVYALLSVERRVANTEAMIGENNPAKRPEVRKKISDALLGKVHSKEQNEKQSASMILYFKTEEGEKLKQQLSSERKGVTLKQTHVDAIIAAVTTDEHREKMRLIINERMLDEEWFNNTFNEEYRNMISMRFKGIPKSKEHRKKISDATIGVPKPWVADKINRNPDKIAKTAAKHRGMKRSDSTRELISARAKERIAANDGRPHNYGVKAYYDPKNPKGSQIQCLPDVKPDGFVEGSWTVAYHIIAVGELKNKKNKINTFEVRYYPYSGNCKAYSLKGSVFRWIPFAPPEIYIRGLEEHGCTVYIKTE